MDDHVDAELLARWNHLVNLLSQQVSQRWKGFLRMAQPQAFMGTVLLVAVPNEYTREVFQSHIKDEFKEALVAAFGAGATDAIVIDTGLATLVEEPEEAHHPNPAGVEAPLVEEAPVQEAPSAAGGSTVPPLHELEAELSNSSPSFATAPEVSPEPLLAAPSAPSSSSQDALPLNDTWDSSARLNPKYTFETFVTGQSNRFAQAAAFAVSESPAAAYNPLFIYGGSGLGKTHLLHAIGHYAKNLYPEMRVRYVNSEEFTNEFINSIRDDEGSSFKQIYRKVDMLLIDDIQFLAGKEHTQEEFFHTFNALHNHRKQVVITSDLPPKQLTGFVERMRSRFEWGLITDVQPPELETRIAILSKKAQN